MSLNCFKKLGRIVVFTILSLLPALVFANSLNGVRVWPSPEDTRVVMDLGAQAQYSYFSLTSPYRLVVDLKNTRLNTKLPIVVTNSPVLKRIRSSSPPDKSTYRLVFELKDKTDVQLFPLKPTPGGGYGHRLVIDFPHEDKVASSGTMATLLKPKKTLTVPKKNKDILIVIDPGHGGEDPGSIGPSHKFEKNVTIAIAKKLAARLDAIPGIRTKLTRTGDYYVSLDKRVAIARKNDAHLMISIHADAFTSSKPRGASVFVLNTRRANTEISRWIENSERQSELLGGSGTAFANNINDPNVNQTLLDLQFSHSQKEGYKLATDVISEIGKVARLHHSKPINTSLAVLRSPQIPSILIETGFISNPTEEKLLFQRSHQDKLARAITKAVVRYLKENPPEGTKFAAQAKAAVHTVKRGESLSVIAAQHNVSVEALKKANNLRSASLAIGQKLTIPSGAAPIVIPEPKHIIETEIITHTVKRGEFLGGIAEHYKVSLTDIRKENHLKSDTLWVGQKLKITVSLKDKPIRKHKVQRGEYLGKIASKYGISVQSIRQANKLRSDELAVGQVLIIPNK